MKIGILTFHSVDNYGAVLQAYALQAFLVSQGHHVEIIDYRPSYFHSPRHWPVRPDRLLGEIYCRIMARRFEQFRTRYLNRTPICLTATDLEKNLPQYDAMIVGSDQVWSPDVDRRKETDPIYFFRWNLGQSTRKIAYAASFGTDGISPEHASTVADGLVNIDIISVRESTGVHIVDELVHRKSELVCDPVFLLTPEQWCGAAGITDRRSENYLVYMPPALHVVKTFADKMRARVVLPSWNVWYMIGRWLGIRAPSPLGWVKLIAESRGVLTKSFHGIAFCILTHTPFVYYRPDGSAASRSTRCVTLLECMGLESRIVRERELTPEKVIELFSQSVDWHRVDKARMAFVSKSKIFLEKVL